MKPFAQRSLTGIVYVSILIGALLIGGAFFYGVFLAILIWSIIEFIRFVDNDSNVKPSLAFTLTVGILIYTLTFLHACGFLIFAPIYIIPGMLIVTLIVELYRKRANPVLNISYSLFCLLYIAVPISLLSYLAYIPLPNHTFEPTFILGFFLLLWTYDTFAFLVGISIGRHKLFERHSPKKSWEGAIGGFIFTIAISILLSKYFTILKPWQWIVTAILISIFGTFGDLTESMFKRSLNKKDSGKMLPGHGGILDRFDSVLLAAPAVFIFLEIIGYI